MHPTAPLAPPSATRPITRRRGADPLLDDVERDQRQLQAGADHLVSIGVRNPFRLLTTVERVHARRPNDGTRAVRHARPRGAGRPRAQARRSSARSGDSGDDGEPAEPARPALAQIGGRA